MQIVPIASKPSKPIFKHQSLFSGKNKKKKYRMLKILTSMQSINSGPAKLR